MLLTSRTVKSSLRIPDERENKKNEGPRRDQDVPEQKEKEGLGEQDKREYKEDVRDKRGLKAVPDVSSPEQKEKEDSLLQAIDNLVMQTGNGVIETGNTDQNQMGNDASFELNTGLTKSGNPRKRKRFEEPLKERLARKKQAAEEKLSMKDPCDITCKKKCILNICEEQRREIHDKYVNMSSEAKGLYIKCLVDKNPFKEDLRPAQKKDKTICLLLKIEHAAKN